MTKLKPKKPSLVEFTKTYSNNDEACYDFFWKARYPGGFVCDECGGTHFRKITRHNVTQCTECGHQHYLFAGTIFQDNKLPLYKLLLGLFLFFVNNKGISAIEMSSHLNVNYKTALLLCRKCRILMKESNNVRKLNDLFYESDTAYIGSKSKEPGHQGMGTEKQPFLVILSTGEENNYPHYVKIFPIPVDASDNIEPYFNKAVVMSEDRVLNTDGKTTYNCLKKYMTVFNEHVDYSDKSHRLHWLNVVIGNIQNQITGIYHGVAKRDLPLFLAEQEYRFNHRYTGKEMLHKIARYIASSYPCPRRSIIAALNAAEPLFTPACV